MADPEKKWETLPDLFPPADSAFQVSSRIMNKNFIRDHIKLNRQSSLVEGAEEVEYFRRLIEEISDRNYSGLLTVSFQYGISLNILDKYLERKAAAVFKQDQMPRSCEIKALKLMLSPRAEEKNLINLFGDHELEEGEVKRLYFAIFGSQNSEHLLQLIEDLGIKPLYNYIWEKGLQKYFNARYRTLKGVAEIELGVSGIVQELGLSLIFDENNVIKRYIGNKMTEHSKIADLKEKFNQENTFKNEAFFRFNQIQEMFKEYPCDFKKLRQFMMELSMISEIDAIDQEGISGIKEYIRSKSVIGAHEVAQDYDFVCPAVMGSDMSHARRVISSSFFNQAQKSKKGRMYLRSEILYNLQFPLASGQCYRLPGGYLLAIINTMDNEEHYLFGRHYSRFEQEIFVLNCIGCFLYFDSTTQAVRRIINFYLNNLGGDIRMTNAMKKMLFALPLVLSLSLLIGVLYYFALGGVIEAFLVGGGLMLIGMMIAGKNGYDEEVTPASHEKIPDYLTRQKGKIVTPSIGPESQSNDKEISNEASSPC
jgi:hypothetical protein